MDHSVSIETRAAERYLLHEMTEVERFEFEAHYFECMECAEDVRAGEHLARAVRHLPSEALAPSGAAPAVVPQENEQEMAADEPEKFKEVPRIRSIEVAPRRRRPLAHYLPTAVAALFGCIVVYQNVVSIPKARDAAATQTLWPTVLLAATRGDLPGVQIDPSKMYSALSLDVNDLTTGSPLTFEIINKAGKAISGKAAAPPPGAPLFILLKNSEVSPGDWTLTLRDNKGTEAGHYDFRIVNRKNQ